MTTPRRPEESSTRIIKKAVEKPGTATNRRYASSGREAKRNTQPAMESLLIPAVVLSGFSAYGCSTMSFRVVRTSHSDRRCSRIGLVAALLCVAVTVFVRTRQLHAESNEYESLKSVTVPMPTELTKYLRTDESGNVSEQAKTALLQLGKALFWDIQVGSDGRTACATCHQTAGADARVTNTVHPGSNKKFDIANGGPGEDLVSGDFPFHKLAMPTDRQSPLLSSIDDSIGLQGVRSRSFLRVLPESPIDGDPSIDEGTPTQTDYFGTDFRQVGRLNAPTNINAMFHHQNLWDGHASDVFNRRNASGRETTPERPILVVVGGRLEVKHVQLTHSSLASQSTKSPVSPIEMSWSGRTFEDIGRKMLALQPLRKQHVHRDDSVLGKLVKVPGREKTAQALTVGYADLIEEAFPSRFWQYNDASGDPIRFFSDADGNPVPNAPSEYRLMEWNFSLFWGIALQFYQQTLRADDTPFDRWVEGDEKALSASQLRGMQMFFGEGRCATCHSGAEFTSASIRGSARGQEGFRYHGIRPLGEGSGRHNRLFKTPGLRNVELTAPYFHNGSAATLRQVVHAYARGFRTFDPHEVDDELPDSIATLQNSPARVNDLVMFLKALTDERVRFRRAPFDHPSLPLPNGSDLPAVGRKGF